MGGAVATSARGHAASYYNPAALTLAKRPSFAAGYQFASLNLKINETQHPTDDCPALVLGFGVPLPFGGPLEDRLSLGFGFILPQGAILLARSPQPSVPSFPLLETRAQTLSVQLALGVRVLDKVSIGFGTLILATLDGAIDATPGATGAVSAKVQNSLMTHLAPVVGILVGPFSNLNLAMTWRAQSLAEYAIPVTAEIPGPIRIPIPSLNIAGVAQFDPQRASLEISYQGIESLSISTGLTYRRWSQFKNPIEYPAAPESYPVQPKPDFHDTLTPRLGIEGHWTLSDWFIEPRLGYSYEPSPAPDQTGFHNYLSNHRHLLTSGFGLRFGDFSLDVAGQFHWMIHRSHTKDTSAENELADNPGFPTVSHGGIITVWSTELGIVF